MEKAKVTDLLVVIGMAKTVNRQKKKKESGLG